MEGAANIHGDIHDAGSTIRALRKKRHLPQQMSRP